MWKILQQKTPSDFVIATGKQYSIRKFVEMTARKLNMKLSWKGKGIKEKGVDQNGKVIIECDKNYFRPLDVNTLLGDARKARKELNWKPIVDIDSLIDEMIEGEFRNLNVIKQKNSKIFVAGHNGMVGSAIIRHLKYKKYKNVIVRNKKKLNLLDQKKHKFFEKLNQTM